MALRDLLTALEDEGAAEFDKAQRTRHHRAAEIVADAHEQAATVRTEALAAIETSARDEARRLIVAARATARRAVRMARDDAIDEIHARVRDRLLELPGTPDGARAAQGCMEEALAALPRAATVRVHPADSAVLQSAVSIPVVADPAAGGAIAEDDEGRYVDNTYLTRLANIWPELRIRLSRSWDDR
jgi:vacuolar-type H+-ATPase subunit E/Vma4